MGQKLYLCLHIPCFCFLSSYKIFTSKRTLSEMGFKSPIMNFYAPLAVEQYAETTVILILHHLVNLWEFPAVWCVYKNDPAVV